MQYITYYIKGIISFAKKRKKTFSLPKILLSTYEEIFSIVFLAFIGGIPPK